MRGGRKSRQKINKKQVVLLCMGGILALALIIGLMEAWDWMQGKSSEEPVRGDLTGRFEEPRTIEYDGKQYQYRKGLTTILFMGVDHASEGEESGQGYRKGGQADFLMLVILDEENKRLTPIQIDRDTMTEITVLGILGNVAGTRRAQICLSHGFGDGGDQSCEFTVDAVEKLFLGIDIDFYISMDMDGISVLNDMLGGIEVTLEDDFSALDPAMTKGTTLTLQGEQAEYYLRSRMNVGIGTNEARMERQNLYIDQAQQVLDAKIQEDVNFVGELYDELEPYLNTNMKRGRMINEAWASRDYERQSVISLQGEHSLGEDGFMEFHPDERALEQLVLERFYEPGAQ